MRDRRPELVSSNRSRQLSIEVTHRREELMLELNLGLF